jgi:hypothetical protein
LPVFVKINFIFQLIISHAYNMLKSYHDGNTFMVHNKSRKERRRFDLWLPAKNTELTICQLAFNGCTGFGALLGAAEQVFAERPLRVSDALAKSVPNTELRSGRGGSGAPQGLLCRTPF